ncbi:hypothetical protein A7317_04965 [Pseudomonas fluorescens]|uniref:DUF1120 domain-containing protein n=1 Tax=Pseudomonas fluorescens TaxID=294 RepID=UPI00083DE183|nr:DUF1120 domain-containing protein [Pseudomonas fluorescens]AOE66363.1 hypothetical protein A7317_04965 [Pseudomonas fluorescens]AOE72142.1 hypothetical protein A7319_04760 [Pseudomonas fluorescens]
MDRFTSGLVASLLIACAPATFASSSTSLSVGGTITPSSCTPTLSSGGIVDHGKLTVKDLNPEQPTRLPTGELLLEVNCEAATFFTLTTVDNRAGTSAIHPASHGLGTINDDQMLGSAAFSVFDAVADTQPVHAIMSSNGGSSWRISSYLGHAGITAFAAPADLYTPIAIKVLNARLSAFTTLVPAKDLPLVDEVPIDGSATLQVKYL